MTRKIRIGTRGSQLALWQANETSRKLLAAGFDPELNIIRTTGDKRHDVSLATIGGKGLFVKEIEEALDREEIDIAVHSLKDVPSIIPDRFALLAFLDRADARDAWIHPKKTPIGDMPAGSKIGTSAPRRRAQLTALYPKLVVEDIRGNVDTRIAKAGSGQYDGIVLASAGLTRLGRSGDITSYFPVDEMIPAAGQGIVAIEARAKRNDLDEVAAALNHEPSSLSARTERGLLQRFGTILDCYSSIAVHSVITGPSIHVSVFVSDPAGKRSIRMAAEAATSDVETLLTDLHGRLAEAGALDLLQPGAGLAK